MPHCFLECIWGKVVLDSSLHQAMQRQLSLLQGNKRVLEQLRHQLVAGQIILDIRPQGVRHMLRALLEPAHFNVVRRKKGEQSQKLQRASLGYLISGNIPGSEDYPPRILFVQVQLQHLSAVPGKQRKILPVIFSGRIHICPGLLQRQRQITQLFRQGLLRRVGWKPSEAA